MFVMTSDGSALTRFERAVKIGNPNIVLAAAHELPKPMLLRDALRVVLVFAVAAPELPAAAARFGARLISERRLSVAEAQLAFAALQTLAGPDREPGAEALCAVLERHHETEAAQYLEQWLRRST